MGGFYGRGTGPIIADDINCVGNETSLAMCGHRDWYMNNCGHNEDAGVICGGILLVVYVKEKCGKSVLIFKKDRFETFCHI